MNGPALLLAATLASLAIGLSSTPATAQIAKKVHRIGIVFSSVPIVNPPGCKDCSPAPLLEEGLRKLGWVNGSNIEILWRSAEGSHDRMRDIVAEFVRLPVDVLVATGYGAVEAARQTKQIPIVFPNVTDPVQAGLAKSFAQPGGNATGLSAPISSQLDGKRLQLLKAVAPRASRVAILIWGGEHSNPYVDPALDSTARGLGLTVFDQPYRRPEDLPRSIDEAVAKGANALMVVHHTWLYWTAHQKMIHEAARRHRLPVLHHFPGAAESGGLLAYGHDINVNYLRTPYYIDRILRGAKPGTLPIEQPSRVELIVNVKAAKAIGLDIPHSVLLQADRVIE